MRKYLLFISLICSIVFMDCAKSNEKELFSFDIPNQICEVNINGLNVDVGVYRHIDVSKLRPVLVVSKGAKVYPPSGAMVDFTNPVAYTVVAENGSRATYIVTVKRILNSGKEILSFTIPNYTSNVFFNGSNIDVEVYTFVDVSSLVPIITCSPKATVYPKSGEQVNFTNPVTYAVTAQDGSMAYYTVTVKKILSRETDIRKVELVGTQQIFERVGDSIFIYVPYETDITNIKTDVTLFDSTTTISPSSGTYMNFSTPQVYTATSSDGMSRNYVVAVKRSPWRKVGNGAFSPRDEIGCLVFKNKIWIFAGWISGQTLHSGEIWNTSDGKNWQKVVTNAPWQAPNTIRFTLFKDSVYAINGGLSCEEIWRSGDCINWEKVVDSVPWGRRHNPYVVVFNNKLWLMGGHDLLNKSTETKVYNDIWSSSDGINWILEKEYAEWPPRGLIYGNVVLNGYIYMYGGGVYTTELWESHKDVWRSSNGINWQRIVYESPWERRAFHTITVHNGKMWLLGGGSQNMNSYVSNEVWYSINGYTWEKMKYTFFPSRHAGGFISFNGKLWIIAGLSCNDIWVLEE